MLNLLHHVVFIGLLVIAFVSAIANALGMVTLCDREKRWPGFFFAVELIGRWWTIPSERKDPWVTAVAWGYPISILSAVAIIVLAEIGG